ncbi:MAG TPA: hypothetical protein VHE37_01320, partial [Nevskiaceae bacterium]|nr:hypothetical protein [Nevskiaceae bacterium]
MTSIAQLWLPILLSSLGVFFASALIHMALRWHKDDYRPLTNEDEVAAAIRKGAPAPGQYMMPNCPGGPKEMQQPEMQKKFVDGPIAFLIVRQPGVPKMGPQLGQWFVLTLVISAVIGHLASVSLSAPDSAH